MAQVRLTLDTALQERGITRYELAKRTEIRYPIIDNYYKNKVTRYDSYVLRASAMRSTAKSAIFLSIQIEKNRMSWRFFCVFLNFTYWQKHTKSI